VRHQPFEFSLVSYSRLLSLPVSAVECAARIFVSSKRSWARVSSPVPTRVFRDDDEEVETHRESGCHVGGKANFIAAIIARSYCVNRLISAPRLYGYLSWPNCQGQE
jgi:hypothetical protein